MSRKPIISANWKMNLNHFEAIQTVQKLYWALKADDYRSADVTVHPPFTDIRSVQTVLEADSIPIGLGAQNCHWEDLGRFTGEVSPAFLSKLNVGYVIVGHSERRRDFGETNEMVAKKVEAVLRNAMTPIMCVGETKEEREAQRAEEVVITQLNEGLSLVKPADIAKLVIAYEPVWAIGNDRSATPEGAQAMCKMVRSRIAEIADKDVSGSVRIQYGGSVVAGNSAAFFAEPDIDGALVGGASLDPDEFARIVASTHA